MWRTIFGLLSPAGTRAQLSTLIFHRVLQEPDPLFPSEVDAALFDRICGWVGAWFNVLPLDEAAARLRDGTLPARALCITFDDGYEDNYRVALPVLKRHGLPATFFVATGFIDGGRMWNDTLIEAVRRTHKTVLDLDCEALGWLGRHTLDGVAERRSALDRILIRAKYLPPGERAGVIDRVAEVAEVQLPTDLMMRSDQVRALRAAGMQIGAHTVSHPILAKLDATAASAEIADSKHWLEELLHEPVSLFAYPNGKPGTDYLPETVQIVRELGFDAAVSTAWGVSGRSTDPHQIPRFTPWDRTRLRFGGRLLANLRRSPAVG